MISMLTVIHSVARLRQRNEPPFFPSMLYEARVTPVDEVDLHRDPKFRELVRESQDPTAFGEAMGVLFVRDASAPRSYVTCLRGTRVYLDTLEFIPAVVENEVGLIIPEKT